MAEGSTFITPEPVAGQCGTDWMRWLDSDAATHAAAVAHMTVRDFPAWVAEHIDEEEDGETATQINLAIVVLLMARLGDAHGVQRVPISMDDAVMMTKALVLDRALATLQTSAVIGTYAIDDPALGANASPFQTSPKSPLQIRGVYPTLFVNIRTTSKDTEMRGNRALKPKRKHLFFRALRKADTVGKTPYFCNANYDEVCPFGTALQFWLNAVLAGPGAPQP